MPPKVINKELYYALKNRIHRFNWRYGDRLRLLGNGDKDLLSEELFNGIVEAWEGICGNHANDYNVTSLGVDEIISEDNFQRFKEAVIELRNDLCHVAINKNLGEYYRENNGVEMQDFTYVSQELFEICMFAVYTYTNFFQQCEHMSRYYHERGMGPRRAKELAAAMHPNNTLRTFEVDAKSREMLDYPLGNTSFEIAKKLHTEDNYEVTFNDSNERPPYYEVKKENDRARAREYEARNREINRKKQERIVKQEEMIRGAEAEDVEREVENGREDFSSYESVRHEHPVVPNENPPSEQNEHVYALFATLGINEEDLTAQTAIDAMRRAHLETKDSNDYRFFLGKIAPLYRQVQALAFETSIKRAIDNGNPIDLNRTVKKVNDVMAALYYTVNPIGFKNEDKQTRMRTAEILNGTYSDVEPNISIGIRNDAIKYMKQQYKDKGIGEFNADAEKIYDSFKTQKKSSKEIAKEAERSAKEYTKYKQDPNGVMWSVDNPENAMRKLTMDNAYALEKRVETRYATGWSRFWRRFSYNAQLKALNKIKESLGIDKNTRVADVYLDDCLDRAFVDSSDPASLASIGVHYTEKLETKALAHVKAVLQNSLTSKRLPEIKEDEIRAEEIKVLNEIPNKEEQYIQDSLDPIGGTKTAYSEMLKEKMRKDEEQREKEELERELAEAEKRKLKQIEEGRREKIRLARIEKEKDYNDRVESAQKRVKFLGEIREKLEKERALHVEKVEKEIKAIPKQVEEIEFQQKDLEVHIKDLVNKVEEITKFLTKKVSSFTEEKISEEESSAIVGFFKNLFKGDETDKIQKEVRENLEGDKVIETMQMELLRLQNLINIENQKFDSNKKEINNLWRKEKELIASKNPSTELMSAVEEHKKAKDYLDELVKKKDEILRVDENAFFQSEDDLVSQSKDAVDGRQSVIIYEAKEGKSTEQSERVDSNKKEMQNSIYKK